MDLKLIYKQFNKITLYILSVYQRYDKYKSYPLSYDKSLHAFWKLPYGSLAHLAMYPVSWNLNPGHPPTVLLCLIYDHLPSLLFSNQAVLNK